MSRYPHDTVTYALRNRIERCLAKLKCSRRLANRYDKASASNLGFIHIADVRLWTNKFVNRGWPSYCCPLSSKLGKKASTNLGDIHSHSDITKLS